jgi:hypothetical protein
VVIRDVTAVGVEKSRALETTKYSEQVTVLRFGPGFNLVIVFCLRGNPDPSIQKLSLRPWIKRMKDHTKDAKKAKQWIDRLQVAHLPRHSGLARFI